MQVSNDPALVRIGIIIRVDAKVYGNHTEYCKRDKEHEAATELGCGILIYAVLDCLHLCFCVHYSLRSVVISRYSGHAHYNS